jgi:hypothetical protein
MKLKWPGVIEATRLLLLDKNKSLFRILEKEHALGRHQNVNLGWILKDEEEVTLQAVE